ncbi:hypothetical protein [uncultured Dysosmobacter sp.]|uniref:hypothetical protein n=1 Tax=uncultured Dysosmobacter sp. TaxID=2591384 RepID=UPI00262FEB87|nr:hypothetical protein [uncultured Dysosmobacter sp.]
MDSYPEYGADASGNFLAFNLVTQPDEQVHIKSSTGSPEKDLEPDDRFLVWKVNSTADTLEVTSGGTKEVYSAAGLKLEEE